MAERRDGSAATLPGYEAKRDEAGLTKREREVRALLVEGKDGPTIAKALGITKQRVSQIVKALEGKGSIRRKTVFEPVEKS